MTVGTTVGFPGNIVPLKGEAEIAQITAATDILTISGVSGQTGDFLVLRDSSGTEKAVISAAGAATLVSTLNVTKGVTLASTLNVTGAATLGSTVTVSKDLTLTSGVSVATDATFTSGLSVAKDATLSSGLSVAKAVTLSSGISVATDATLSSGISVAKDATLSSGLSVAKVATFSSFPQILGGTVAVAEGASTAAISKTGLSVAHVVAINGTATALAGKGHSVITATDAATLYLTATIAAATLQYVAFATGA